MKWVLFRQDKGLANLLLSPTFAARALEDFLNIRLYDSDKEDYVEKASMMWIWILTQDPQLETQSQSLAEAVKNIYDNTQRPFSSAATHAAQTVWSKRHIHDAQDSADHG